jgi:hypothetical protein
MNTKIPFSQDLYMTVGSSGIDFYCWKDDAPFAFWHISDQTLLIYSMPKMPANDFAAVIRIFMSLGSNGC